MGLDFNKLPDRAKRVWKGAQVKQYQTMASRFHQLPAAQQAKIFANKKLFALWQKEKFSIEKMIVSKNGMQLPMTYTQALANLEKMGAVSQPQASVLSKSAVKAKKPPVELPPSLPVGDMPPDKWAKSLSSDELRVIDYWQGSGYEDIRNIQRTGKGSESLKTAIDGFEKALDRAKPYEGTVWRGLHDLDDKAFNKLSKSKTIEWKSLTSSASNQKAALRFVRSERKGGRSVLFEIRNKSGIDLTSVVGKEEAEVLLRKGAKYRVVGQSEETYTVIGKKFKALRMVLEEI